MQTLTGLYIEDEPNNLIVTQGLFSFYPEIKLIGLDHYPQKLEGIYEVVIDKSVDFLLIDHELDKMSVPYKGIDVLREIRRHDSNIYAVLLTNYPLDDYKGELGEYDFQLNKGDLSDPEKMKELVAKIKRACALRSDNDALADMGKRQDELQYLLAQIKSAVGKD